MSWQDRDYARRPAGAWPGGQTQRGLGLLGGSIVKTLIAINVAVFVLAMLNRSIGKAMFEFGAMQGRAVMHGEVWRLFTAQYLHAGTVHLLFNMLVLYFMGRPLERMWPARRFFVIYTMCGLSGNVFYTILAFQGVIDPKTLAVGASGCIYGLIGIVAVLFPTATVWVYFLFPVKIRTLAIILGGVAFLTVLGRGENYGGEACHLAGLVFGVWWAMKGEAWWSRTQWRMPRRSVPRPRRPSKSSFAARIQQRREDAETIDRILKKVYDGGIHSLTEDEKRALQEATERQRQREREAGRVDRL